MSVKVDETQPRINSVVAGHHSSGGTITIHRPEAWTKLEPHDIQLTIRLRDQRDAPNHGAWVGLTPDDALELAECLTVFAMQQVRHLPRGLYVP